MGAINQGAPANNADMQRAAEEDWSFDSVSEEGDQDEGVEYYYDGDSMMEDAQSFSESSSIGDNDSEEDHCDSWMDLEEQERVWASKIKEAVEASSSLENLSDMEYGQHAIIARGNLQDALKRIEGLQCFRKEYKIDNTPDQGINYLKEVCKLQPGAFLHIDICPITGEGVLAWDLGSSTPGVALQCFAHDTVPERNWRIHAGACYYMFQTVQPSFQSIREGTFWLLDVHSMGWENVSMSYQKRLHEEVWMHYPFKIKKIMEYNTNGVASIFWSLMKRIMPEKFVQVMELGCRVEETDVTAPIRTLSELYLQPSLEESTFHLLNRARELLTLRSRNEASFRL